MQRGSLVVKYVASCDCFVHLPATYLRRLETEASVIKVSHNGNTYYFSCIPRADHNATLCIGATYARNLKLREGDEVFVHPVNNVLTLSRINIVPCTASDYELLQMQMQKVQATLLNQVKIVARGQPIVAWISKFSSVSFTTVDLKPKVVYGSLEQFTEVHVSSMPTRSVKEGAIMRGLLGKVLPFFLEEDRGDPTIDTKKHALIQSFCKKSPSCVYRVYPLPVFHFSDPTDAYDASLISPYYILMPKSYLPTKPTSTNWTTLWKVKKVPEYRQHDDGTNANLSRDDEPLSPKSSEEIIARIYILEDMLACSKWLDQNYFDQNIIHPCAYVPDSLRVALKLKTGSRIVVRAIKDDKPTTKPTSINIFPYDQSITAPIFEDYVITRSQHEPLLLNSPSTIIFSNGRRCVVQMLPASCNHAMIDAKHLKNLPIHIRPVLESTDDDILEDLPAQDINLDKIFTSYLEKTVETCEIALDVSLGVRKRIDFAYSRENILIHGALGSGKTTLCKILIARYRKAPCFMHTHMIDCRLLKGKKVEALQKIITPALSECVYYQPAILFLDNLESIASASMKEEDTIDATHTSRVSDMLHNIITQYQEYHYISIVATCSSPSKINPRLRPARGVQFFRTVVSMSPLETKDRIDILRLTLGDDLYEPACMNWNHCGNKTEGWMPQDLVDLVEKAKFSAWKRSAKGEQPSRVTKEDINSVLKNFTPMSMQGMQLYKSDGFYWSNIGGLVDVKSSLMEILQWPLKYPNIFKNAPIKLQSGILLYGMPGTGKTMLARAIANECDVNLISIKGPELLSKYIGVSEESVRNVFMRASHAKPCVLFFDEFDSLAPRRGHDRTGVTDRVVNQLLTQLDGVEDRNGVAVVAATSRPDLLDPALLRPGRLDKCLYCPLPNEAERAEIFATLCDLYNISKENLDLKQLALHSEGFTGADIKATITQARLKAYDDMISLHEIEFDASDFKVLQSHLVESVKVIKPSLSAMEKIKYANIYAQFTKKDTFVEEVLKNQKATLY